jgi:DNA-directed RNA polymerase subunit RPC12/RpoP
MPFKDGTGPPRQGEGRRQGRRGGRGRMGGNLPGFGAGGYCVCPNCGLKMLHKAGFPCNEQSCPECGSKMVREP